MSLSARERAAVARWRPATSRINRMLAWGVITWSRRVMTRANQLSILGLERLRALQNRGDRGLLTFSNHVSRLDDPLLVSNFGLAELPYERMRWVAADALKLFGDPVRAFIFSAGKCVPTVRGGGLDQPGLHFLRDRLKDGAWVHIFPEGGANRDPAARLRHPFKPGIGRLIDEARPIVLPFVHRGMQRIAPHGEGPQRGHRVDVLFGHPTDCDDRFMANLSSARPADGLETWEALAEWSFGVLKQLESDFDPAQSGPETRSNADRPLGR